MSGAGFELRKFLFNIQSVFEEAFFVGDSVSVLNSVVFGSTSRLRTAPDESKPNDALDNLKMPACILDLYGFQADNDPYSSGGVLQLNARLRALVIVEKAFEGSRFQVCQLAMDVAGLVTEKSRFGVPSGMSMVRGIGEMMEIENHFPHLIGWEVDWQQSVEIPAPDYSAIELREFPKADAADIYRLKLIDLYLPTEILELDDGSDRRIATGS